MAEAPTRVLGPGVVLAVRSTAQSTGQPTTKKKEVAEGVGGSSMNYSNNGEYVFSESNGDP